MTSRKPQLVQAISSRPSRSPLGGRRDRTRQKRNDKRRALLENLETRQLLAGPDLIGVQPNEGSLLFDGSTLNVSPREIVFQFDDNSEIDPDTLDAIRITRAGDDGVFESASATTDLGTGGQALVEFRAKQSGSIGNGITLNFTSTQRVASTSPVVSVSGRNITVDLASNAGVTTRLRDVLTAINNDTEANVLVEAISVSGSTQNSVSPAALAGSTVVLAGANAAEAVTDFGTNGLVRIRLVSALPGADGLATQVVFEQQNFGSAANPRVFVTGQTVRVQLNSFAGQPSTAADFVNAINNNSDAAALFTATLQQGQINTVIGNRPTSYSPLALGGVSDVLVKPGFVGLGESPREVVFRFAEPLPDDVYQIDVLGTGISALRNVDGERFQDGEDLRRNFSINLGPQVLAVVPEPVRRAANGSLSPETGIIEVHFDNDDLDFAKATDPNFYKLIFTADTVTNTDDALRTVVPTIAPTYDPVTNIVRLDFGRPLSRIPNPNNPVGGNEPFYTGAARLRIGSNEALPTAPFNVDLLGDPQNPSEPGDSFATAFDLNSQWTLTGSTSQSATLRGDIFNTEPFELELPGPDLPGTRVIRPEDPARLTRPVPLAYVQNGADSFDGISVIQYDFADSWLGDDPSRAGIADDTTYFSVISEQQKQRVREVLQLFSEYLGVNFVEVEGSPTSNAFFSITVGDLYGGATGATSGPGGTAVVTKDRDGDGVDDLGVLDFQDFDESIDDQFGEEFFRGAMFLVGQLLGYGYADDLPQPVSQSTDFVFTPGTDNEPAFPSVADIVHGQYLYRPDSTDIDLFRFELTAPGEISVETIAERLSAPSLLDTTVKLFKANSAGGFDEISRNDDYFSNDSLVSLQVDAGIYMIGVSAKGNDTYDPTISGTGFGGLSEGEYELRVDFKPSAVNSITDTTGIALDGDADGRPGGIFDFWFVPSDPGGTGVNRTIYVDKLGTATGGQIGTVGNPFNEIDLALASADPGDTVRVIGNGGTDGLLETAEDNFSYQIGVTSNGLPLVDGATLDVPQGVHLVIDAGAVIKMNRSRIGVGSTSPLIDLSDASIQILGTPTIIGANGLPARDDTNQIIPGSVFLTSINDDSVGAGNSPTFTPAPSPGDWGGIDFRGDLDSADESRRNRENEGTFLNQVQYADIRYGGGSVSIGGRQTVVSPIDMAITRPTIINSSIRDSADAAMAATPDTFAETRFTDPFFQGLTPFTPDYSRIGPEIHGNTVIDNSINGLFIRLSTRTGDQLETISLPSRFDDSDITHVLAENLVIEGTPGGPVIQSTAPSSLLIRPTPTTGGAIPTGTYVYRITNVNASGLESAASQPTIPVTLAAGQSAIQLSQLPTVASGTDFVSRRLYRAEVVAGIPGQFSLVAQLNASNTSHRDTVATGSSLLSADGAALRSRLDASLVIDPGTVLKLDGARIEARFGANLIAEGLPSLPIVFTSIEDQRYGAGGTFDTNDRGDLAELNPGDWGGIYIGHGSTASIDHAVITGGGGTTRIEGGFASFNALEVHQATLRLTNTTLEQNADGRGTLNGTRVGRGDNSEGTVFISASQPIIVGNDFVDGGSAALSFDINSLSSLEVSDHGRSTGDINRIGIVGNTGPLIQNNSMTGNAINGLQVRGGELATAGVWDDVDMVHVVTDSIEIPNQHIYGGLRLQSDARGSLVVKFESAENENAGIVVGGTLLTAANEFVDIADRIGGALQVIGHPDFPVVLTTLADDSAGAGFTRDGQPAVDTNGDGVNGSDLGSQTGDGFRQLPAGPEVNLATTINNDVDPATPGYFEATLQDGHLTNNAGVTVVDANTGQTLVNQNYFFDFATYIIVNNVVTRLNATTITQPVTLIADDVVESRGTFAGPNGEVTWIAQTSFRDGVPVMFSGLDLEAAAGTTLGDVQIVNFFHPDIGFPGFENVFPCGDPGTPDFRATTYQVDQQFGFAHGGYYENDGTNQENASYIGWAADIFTDLETQIAANTQTYSLAGDIDLTSLPAVVDPAFGSVFGPGDVNTAFAWQVDPSATTSTVTSFVELLDDANQICGGASVTAGLWDGVIVREAASDRNVAAVAEQEPIRTAVFGTNDIPDQSQFLGELAPDLKSGDENRRLGFVIDGAITTRDDLDVYSFVAESNTEVWLDIDRTGNQFDSVVELIDANGRILASSNDSIAGETNSGAIFVNTAAGVNSDAAQGLSVVQERLGAQQITVSESAIDEVGGNLFFTHSEATVIPATNSRLNAVLPVDVFLADPAGAVKASLEATFPELGTITATLLRRTDRIVETGTNNLLRAGDDFVVQLQFDETQFVGRSVPVIDADASNIPPVNAGVPFTATVSQLLTGNQLQDAYTTNPKDAGMRLVLPGEANTRNLYHIRVRSSNVQNPLDFTNLTDNSKVRDGLTTGRYELQVRLREQDERPGTQVRLADIRYATTGLQIIGQPLHSPLLGEEHEQAAPNDLLSQAQPLGFFGAANDATPSAAANILQSDTLSKSFGGELDSATDVDWYQFTIDYQNLTRDGAAHYLSTVFDLDYASNFARADMALYVFNAAGELILIGGDSNVADDQPGSVNSNDTGDLSRGSAGSQDPYIGAAELQEGTYFVAVANQQQVPLPLDQFFDPASLNPLLRLEPITSVTRIAEDHIFSSRIGVASQPEVPVLFDNNSFQEYSFDDVLLYVNTSGGLILVNPFTGANYGNIGDFDQNRTFSDIAFTSNGELFGYSDFVGPSTDTTWFYHRIDTSNASLSAPLSTGAGISTFQWNGVPVIDAVTGQEVLPRLLDVASNTGLAVEAITIRNRNGVEEGFFVGNRPDVGALEVDYFNNILYRFDEQTGAAQGANVPLLTGDNAGAGTTPREVGQIDTAPALTALSAQLGITNATEIDAQGVARQSIFDGNSFTLDDLTNPPVTFEFEQSNTLTALGNSPVRDGDAIQIDGRVFEFNTGARVQLDAVAPSGQLTEGSSLTVGTGTSQVIIEYVRFGQAAPGNVAIGLVDGFGNPRSISAITADTVSVINDSVPGLNAQANFDEVFFGISPTTLTSGGGGVTVQGDGGLLNPGAVAVPVDSTVAAESLITTLANVINASGIAVSASGTQLALPSSNVVTIITGSSLTLSGSPGVTPGNIPILLLPTDSAATLASRIETAVESQLPNVTVTPRGTGRSLSIAGPIISNTVGPNIVAGGIPTGGRITGVELVGSTLYAVDNAGGLFSVSSGELSGDAPRQVGRYVSTATDLVGINFSGLRAGPASVQDGELRDILFGITSGGDIYAFNTFGELQPVFAGGRSVISTGIAGAEGLDFSTLDYNLWHVTDTRELDPGHGINELDPNGAQSANGLDDSYRRTDFGLNNNSLAFNYERGNHGGNYASLAERPDQTPRTDGQNVASTYNFPGGAKGVLNSNQFSLEGYSANDKPVLYFNYFLETDVTRDRLRVYVVGADGSETLVASNSEFRQPGFLDDEFDDPDPFQGIDVQVQQIFDGTGTWRQARVPLGDFAGQSGLGLRIEFTTNGTTQTFSDASAFFGRSSPTIRTVAADSLVDGQTFQVNNEEFVIDFAPTLQVPSGSQLADLYSDPLQTSVLTIDGQDYLLNDGTRTATASQISINLLNNTVAGTTLSDLSSQEIATAIAEGVRLNPPPNPGISGFSFSDPEDDPASAGRNDFIYEATSLPYSGGNLTITGTGRLGTDPANGAVTHIDDVDLLRVNVTEGTTISTDVDFDFNTNSSAVIRYFDAEGNSLTNVQFDAATGAVQYTATSDGVIYIGISGTGNNVYDPRLPGTAAAGLVDSYSASISMDLSTAILTEDNAIELNGLTSLSASPSNLFTVTGANATVGNPVRVSRFMTSTQVAQQVQRAIANRFTSGDTTYIPSSGPTLTLAGFTLNDPGPFALPQDRYGDNFTTDEIPDPVNGDLAESSLNNEFEGVYLDDFIIGFAERGEVATASAVVDTAFITNGLLNISTPGDPASQLSTGTYQVEIRDASEYVETFGIPTAFRTFDTNDRLVSSSRSIVAKGAAQIQDGFSFSIFDGRSTVEFEFDLIESNTGVTPGRVQIPYTLLATDPLTGVTRPQTSTEVASSIIAAINRSDVQSLIDVPALQSSGVDAIVDDRINLFGDVVVTDQDGGLAEIAVGSNRGDDNRERESQGVILIENSRFLFNEDYGIDIAHDANADINGTSTESIVRYPRNLIELNSESLVPGVVVQSNVFAFNAVGGLQVAGLTSGITETGNAPIPYERIVNNTFIGGRILSGSQSPAATINGIVFDQGNISFADSVISYNPSAGGGAPTSTFQDSTTVLGAPDGPGRGPEPADGTTTVSLGLGGSITVEFTNNLLTGSGDSRPDLVVFEAGAVESVRVEISRDGVNFFDVGELAGLTNQLDIDAAGFGLQDRFAFVRLTDNRQGDINIGSLGADIDAIGAISTVPVDLFGAAGIGVNIVGNAAPTLLNNVISNSETGVVVDPANTGVVLGGNSYYRNTTDVPTGVSLGQFSEVLSPSEVVFVDAADLVFAPAAGASIIDSSIDSLPERASLVTVRNPLGIPASPILAPRLDVNGQLRVDDPNVETPSGLGERVFKDRGASDRGDLAGPRAILLSPRAPGLGIGAGVVSVLGDAPSFFEVQLIDGLAPADVTPGTGVNDRTVDSGSVLVLKDNVALVEGVDYRFGYNPSTNIIRLTPIAGVWEQDSTYVIRMVDASDAVITASNGNDYVDGGVLNVLDTLGESTAFEYELGIQINLSTSLTAAQADGIVFEVFDGNTLLSFELNSDDNFDNTNNEIPIPEAGTSQQIADAIAAAINSSTALNFTAATAGSTIQLLGGTPLSSVTTTDNFVTTTGAIGTSTGFGFQIPFELAAPASSISDGQTFTIRRGAVDSETFEFTTDGVVNTADAIAINIGGNQTLDQIADQIVRAVGGTGLGVNPSNVGAGRIFLGADANYSLDLSNSTLTQIGVPGEVATVAIPISIGLEATEVSPVIKAVIDAQQLAGVSTTLVDTRVFVEGTVGVNGVGAVDLITIADEVGNQLQNNQVDGRTELTIFIGSGFDFGDAPTPYASLDVDGGPRHAVDTSFAIGATVTPDSNAQLVNADNDDGISLPLSVQTGFDIPNLTIDLTVPVGKTFYLDAWFDWDGDGVFENNDIERRRFGSVGTGRTVLQNGSNSIEDVAADPANGIVQQFGINVPADAKLGETYARFRLSEIDISGPNGDILNTDVSVAAGEIEDVRLLVTNNPFQNPTNFADVNASGFVTPLDALQIINLLASLNPGQTEIDLSSNTLPANMPQFPDANGSGAITPSDILQVINYLAEFGSQQNGNGEQLAQGEFISPASLNSSFVPVNSGGVLAGATTLVGDVLLKESAAEPEAVAPVAAQPTSVFDQPEAIKLDSLVDDLAADATKARESADADGDTDLNAIDELFASL
ncbi:dockerin type I domain-containing protein [Planctomycetes bacterium K23_9]|uniref:GEVED domain-containing protein n=1 Tax=Stieleria marina TaxID=1930275 RepID=A0A517NNR9_9BACT|nr:hypothetical protein K239x_07080 [Planctomycetes bacterium K23_9]